jgi:acetolactate decarboxylase
VTKSLAINNLFQVSTGNAMIAGLYQGAINFAELAKEGDFGLGSVKNMDGEMIAINGKFYRITPDGKMNFIPAAETTPYAMVTYFHPIISININNINSFKQLVNKLNQYIINRNIPYAIHLKGEFNYLKLRAVRGANPPYPPFLELVKQQAIFDLNNVDGDGVGFFYPVYLNKINVPGYHIHFITTDKKIGGHILEIQAKHLVVELMPIDQLVIQFPHTEAFSTSKKLNIDNMPLMIQSFGDGIQSS